MGIGFGNEPGANITGQPRLHIAPGGEVRNDRVCGRATGLGPQYGEALLAWESPDLGG
jgi:hypothetical protein